MAKIKDMKMDTIKDKAGLDANTIAERLAFIPIIIILGIVPLVMRLKVQTVTGQDISYALGSNFTDLFSYWKSAIIFAVAIVMGLGSFFLLNKEQIKKSRYIKVAVIALGVFGLFTLVSAFLSEHQSLVWWGQYGTRGGVITIVSYGVICLYSLHFYRKKEDIRYIFMALIVMIVIESIIIISQFLGKDILFTDFVKALIIPSEYKELGDTMNWNIEGKAYGSLYNPNYVGSFVALLLPIFIFLGFKSTSIMYKLASIMMVGFLGLSLFASGSRAGIIGIMLSIVVSLILFGKVLFRSPKALLIVLGITGCLCLGLNIATDGVALERISSVFTDAKVMLSPSDEDYLKDSLISDVYLKDNKFTMEFPNGEELNMTINGEDEAVFTDKGSNNIECDIVEDIYLVPKMVLPVNVRVQMGKINYETYSKNIYVLEIEGVQWFIITSEDGELITLDKYANPIEVGISEGIGFKGKEKIGSNRGYLWSRTLPIIRDNLIFGVGPDAFVAEFPNGDKISMWNLYNTAGMFIDKPHNLYLQIGINQGIIALAAFLVLNITYIVNSFKVYKKKSEYSFHDMFGIGIMLGIVGYLGAGMFNDSVVSVAPLYWCLLGIGFAVNYINSDNPA